MSSPTTCKKGFVSDAGPFQLTVDSDGSLEGSFYNGFGNGVFVGNVSSKGKVAGYAITSDGESGKIKAKIASDGQLNGNAKTKICKFTIYGIKE